jgi:SAM-dependent methyltransferase
VRDPSANWEAIAATHPYFGVLTDPRFLGAPTADALAEFFRTGDADAEFLLTLIERHTGTKPGRRVIDFGCGVGRLSLAFARRGHEVTGIDVSSTMRTLATRHRDAMQLTNANFVDDVATLRDGAFDVAVSLIVFQHIPVARGEELLRHLLRKLAPGGTAALHFTFARPGGRFRRLARKLRASSPWLHRTLQILQRDPLRLPYMEMNEYDRTRILRIFESEGLRSTHIEPTDHGGMSGGIVVAIRCAQNDAELR